jgi:nickel-type superoxide dismutase maturation protease
VPNTLKNAGLIEFTLWLFRLRRRFVVINNSMLPVLKPGEVVLVNPYAYRRQRPQAGDIVLARHPSQQGLKIVKRIESITPDNLVILVGDNSAESNDSRDFGPVPLVNILGQVSCLFGSKAATKLIDNYN